MGEGFEAVVAAGRAVGAKADLAEIEVKIIADRENIAGRNFVEMSESLDGDAGIIIEILRFEEDVVAGLAPDSPKFGLLPS